MHVIGILAPGVEVFQPRDHSTSPCLSFLENELEIVTVSNSGVLQEGIGQNDWIRPYWLPAVALSSPSASKLWLTQVTHDKVFTHPPSLFTAGMTQSGFDIGSYWNCHRNSLLLDFCLVRRRKVSLVNPLCLYSCYLYLSTPLTDECPRAFSLEPHCLGINTGFSAF